MADSADPGREFSGKSVDEATAEGLAALGLTREQAEIEVINKGSRGIFGLGSEPARVLIRRRSSAASTSASNAASSSTASKAASRPATPPPARKPEPIAPEADEAETKPTPKPTRQATPPQTTAATESQDKDIEDTRDSESESADSVAVDVSDEELSAMSVELLQGLVERMGFEAEVTASWHEDDEDDNNGRYLRIDINGDDVSPLIGRRGETLAGLQYLVRLMVNQRIKQWKNIVVDVDQYKERRVTQLTQLAHRMADQVTDSGRAVSLEPMPPHERRIVHLALRDHATVYTQSSGEGERRKVHIVAKD